MTLTSEIIKRGSIECGQCPAMRKVRPDGEVLPCGNCGDPEFNLPGTFPEPAEVDFGNAYCGLMWTEDRSGPTVHKSIGDYQRQLEAKRERKK
jgi:hypothetical protein